MKLYCETKAGEIKRVYSLGDVSKLDGVIKVAALGRVDCAYISTDEIARYISEDDLEVILKHKIH